MRRAPGKEAAEAEDSQQCREGENVPWARVAEIGK
jgi:hypothetical protein